MEIRHRLFLRTTQIVSEYSEHENQVKANKREHKKIRNKRADVWCERAAGHLKEGQKAVLSKF